jgi:hypothetical protein
MLTQMRRRLDHHALAPALEHSGRHIREQAGGQPDGADCLELLDLREHRLQVQVPRRGLDQAEHVASLVVLVVIAHRQQPLEPRDRVLCEPRDDPLAQGRLRAMDRSAHDPLDPALRRRLHPPLATAR